MGDPNKDRTSVLSADMSEARLFGGGRPVPPEGTYYADLLDCYWDDTERGLRERNGDKILVFELRSTEPGCEGVLIDTNIWLQGGRIAPVGNMDEKQLQNVRIARDKLYSAMRAHGLSEQAISANAKNIAVGPALFLTQTHRKVCIRIEHKLDAVENPTTQQKVLLANGQPKHRTAFEAIFVPYEEHDRGLRPKVGVLSATQQVVEAESKLGPALVTPTAFQPTPFAPQGAYPGAVAQPNQFGAPVVPFTGPSMHANPFAAPTFIPAPNGPGGLPTVGPGLATALTSVPPR